MPTTTSLVALKLLEDVDEFLPPFRAVFYLHDNPEHVTGWELRERTSEHTRPGTCTLFRFSVLLQAKAVTDIDVDKPVIPTKIAHGSPAALQPRPPGKTLLI